MSTVSISPRQTGKDLAYHLAWMTNRSAPSATWCVGVADLSRWTRWRLRRRLEREAPANITVELNEQVRVIESRKAPTLPCWVLYP